MTHREYFETAARIESDRVFEQGLSKTIEEAAEQAVELADCPLAQKVLMGVMNLLNQGVPAMSVLGGLLDYGITIGIQMGQLMDKETPAIDELNRLFSLESPTREE